MALVACKECGHKISTEARYCPSCGATAVSSSARVQKIAAWAFLIICCGVFTLIVIGMWSGDDKTATVPTASISATPQSDPDRLAAFNTGLVDIVHQSEAATADYQEKIKSISDDADARAAIQEYHDRLGAIEDKLITLDAPTLGIRGWERGLQEIKNTLRTGLDAKLAAVATLQKIGTDELDNNPAVMAAIKADTTTATAKTTEAGVMAVMPWLRLGYQQKDIDLDTLLPKPDARPTPTADPAG